MLCTHIGNDGIFDAKSYECKFFGYFLNSRAYKVYNINKHIVEESIDVTFKKSNYDLLRDEEDDTCDDNKLVSVNSTPSKNKTRTQQAETTKEQVVM